MSKEVTDASFQSDVLEHDKPIMVDFWAEWCGPCRAVSPILDKIAEENSDKLDIVKLNVDDNPETALKYGITSIPAYGHTPGHTAFAISSGGESMLMLSDTTNHPWLFARHPEWQGVFDMDGNQAVTTRRRLLDRAVADKMLVAGYHFPFPAAGHIVKAGTGYDLVPVMWRPL